MDINAGCIFDGSAFIPGGKIQLQKGKIVAYEPGGIGGATMVAPGFLDSHLHLINLGLVKQGLQLGNCRSAEDFKQSLAAYATSAADYWLTGRGWDQNNMGFTPDRWLLDSVCPNRPVLLTRVCGHVAVASTKALELAGITGETVIDGGVVGKDESGALTGVLEEKAVFAAQASVPAPEPATLYNALVSAIKYVHSCGITGVHSDDRRQVVDYQKLWDLYLRVTQSYPLRVQLHYSVQTLSDLKEYIRLSKEISNTEFVWRGSAKIFLDGSLGAGTAALLQDYTDRPGNRGVLVYEDAALQEYVALAEEHGVSLAVHAIGDGAAAQFLRILAQVRGGVTSGRTQHRLVHMQVTNLEQLQKAKALGIAIEIQPVFLRTDMHWAEKRLGTSRLQTSYCWRTMAKTGLLLSGGSDSPVEDANPWLGIGAAVTRKDGGGRLAEGWQQDESLGLEAALSLFTSAPAQLAGWRRLGHIKPGYWADLALYSPFRNEYLEQNQPERVWVAGEIVYQR